MQKSEAMAERVVKINLCISRYDVNIGAQALLLVKAEFYVKENTIIDNNNNKLVLF